MSQSQINLRTQLMVRIFNRFVRSFVRNTFLTSVIFCAPLSHLSSADQKVSSKHSESEFTGSKKSLSEKFTAKYKEKFTQSMPTETFKAVSQSEAWQNLLYFDQKKEKSIVTNQNYFISNKSEELNPEDELEKALAAFSLRQSANHRHPQCIYPARYLFLKQHFDLAPPVKCSAFEDWKKTYQPSELYIAIASQYIANPASVFGHSFLLISSKTQTPSFWYSYNFAAGIPNTVNGLEYIVGGLFGGFTASYTLMPLYQRMHQYGSVEDRDLWLYKIKVSKQELEFLIAHLWELVHLAEFEYYFLNENCAGVLLRTLAATFSDLNDLKNLGVTESPINVIKKLKQKGRVLEPFLLPSASQTLKTELQLLSRAEKTEFKQILKSKALPVVETVSMGSTPVSPTTLDALLEYLSFERIKNSSKISEDLVQLDREVHIERSKMPRRPPNTDLVKPTTSKGPESSHDSSALTLGGTRRSGGTNRRSQAVQNSEWDLSFRYALHDLLDPHAGFLDRSAIEVLRVAVSGNDRELYLRELSLARIDNYQSFESYAPRYAWRFQLGAAENLASNESRSLRWGARGGFGLGTEFFGQYFYALLSSDLHINQPTNRAMLEIGPELGVFLHLHPRLQTLGSIGLIDDPFQIQKFTQLKISQGLGWQLTERLSLIETFEFYEGLSQSRPRLSVFRLNMGARIYF